ncbi:FAD-binding oxidoreductase, partial [bacterium]|nr:FAD-binding oxidoreductase [bacterium]
MLLSARLILADGTLLDTGDAASKADFLKSHPDFIAKICSLRDAVKSDKELVAKIRRKYAIKNVTGLSINAFVDFDDPFQIITNLIVGSEGTLAFLAEATMKTIEDLPYKASAML